LPKRAADSAAPASPEAPPMSDFIAIRVDDRPNLNPAVAYNSRHGEFLVVWEEHIHGGYVAIYGRRVGLNAQPIGPAFVVAGAENQQYLMPAVAYSNQEDHYLVAWVRKVTNDDYDVWATPVRWDGLPTYDIVIDTDANKDWYPAVAFDSGDNEFLVVYEKWVSDTRRDIEAQRVRAWNWSRASWRNLAGGDNQIRRLPDVSYLSQRNEYLISYTYQTPPLPPTNGDLVALRSNPNMSWLSSEFYISPTGSPPQGRCSLASGPDEYLAAWDEEHGANMDAVWARRLAGDGSPQSFINIAHISGQHNFESDVAFGDGGHYLVVWRTIVGAQPSWDWNIMGRTVRQGQDVPEGPAFSIDSGAAMQKNPAVACAGANPCLIVYEDDWPGGANDYEIRGRLVGHQRIFVPLTLRRGG
jgi:hypothetical protein